MPWPSPCGVFELGTTVAAFTHFSAMSWRRMSRVVVIVSPPRSMHRAGLGARAAQPRVVSSLRTCHTNWGACHWLDCWRGEDHRLGARGVEVGGGERAAGQRRPALLHQVEDLVAALHDRRVGGDDELRLVAGVRLRLIGARVEALEVRVLDQVVGRRRLGERGEDRGLREREVLEVLAEVAPGRGGHAVRLVAVVVLVEVGGHDPLLAVDARVGLGDADRLDDLAQLAGRRQVGLRPRRSRTAGAGGPAAG